jgi:Mrp family chromosome partitioning ATPase
MNATALPDSRPPQSTAATGAVEPTATTSSGLSFDELARRMKIWLGAIAGHGPTANRELDELDHGLKIIQERTSRVISVSFTAKNPERAAAVVNRVVQLYANGEAEQRRAQANQELAALDDRAGKLKHELDRAGETIQTLLLQQPPVAAGENDEGSEKDGRLRALEREAAASGQAYAGLLQRQKDIRDQQEIVTPGVSVLSLASPPDRPSSFNPILFIFPALVASLISASLLAIVLERLDQGLRTVRDVTDALGLPCIGLVPQLPRSRADRRLRHLLSEPFTPYTEAIRSVAATLCLAEPHRKPMTILISSSVPGEGKTTMAASLCIYAALLGRRALLVDFDCRHPSALRALGSRPKTPLPDLKNRPLQELIQHIPDLNLDFLAMPRDATDPLAPFVGKRMQGLLGRVGSAYDCVFIDSPPLLGVTETRLLAALVDSVVFVIKWGSTRREVAQNAGDVLRCALQPDRRGAVSVSALVTQVDLKRHADYRYGDVGEAFAKYRKYYFGSAKT